MAANTTVGERPAWRAVRWLVWGGAACVLLLPLAAMRLTGEVAWTGIDFAVMGALLGLACVAFELTMRVARSPAYVFAAGTAIAAAFLIVWSNLAVGIIGDESDPANLIFFGVIAVGIVGVSRARSESSGMARAMEATACAQALACVAALVLDGPYVFLLTGVFLAMWLFSAWLFRKAARQEGLAAR